MSNQDPGLRAQLQSFAVRWKGFKNDSRAITTAFGRFPATRTNELEGVFKLTSDSSLRLVRSGILPETVEILRRTTVYGGKDRGNIARVCADILKVRSSRMLVKWVQVDRSPT